MSNIANAARSRVTSTARRRRSSVKAARRRSTPRPCASRSSSTRDTVLAHSRCYRAPTRPDRAGGRAAHRGNRDQGHELPDTSDPPTRAGMTRDGRLPQPSCGLPAVHGLAAPPFFAAEWPRRLLAESAPFGMRMGGKSERESLQTLRRYQRNLSQPLKCAYATCAVVGSAGSLRGTDFGTAIDAHAAVIRVNAAPVRGHEEAVGRRTTWRVHNSEKPYFMASLGHRELQLVVCHMQWIGACQHLAFGGAFAETASLVLPPPPLPFALALVLALAPALTPTLTRSTLASTASCGACSGGPRASGRPRPASSPSHSRWACAAASACMASARPPSGTSSVSGTTGSAPRGRRRSATSTPSTPSIRGRPRCGCVRRGEPPAWSTTGRAPTALARQARRRCARLTLATGARHGGSAGSRSAEAAWPGSGLAT